MRRLLLVLCVVGVALACGISADAHAQQQGTSTDEEARARFEAGRAHYDAGRFREALTEFRAAYELSPRPLLLYNIYLASLDLGEIHDAADALRRYLATDEVDPNERTQLQARLRALDERIAREGTGSGDGSGDGDGSGSGDGDGDGSGSGDGSGDGSGGGGAGGGETGGGGGIPTLTWISWGAGAAFAVSTAVFGLLALSIESDVLDDCGAAAGLPEDHCDPSRESDADTGQTFALIADISLGLAVVGAAVGTIVLLTSGGDDDDASRARTRPRSRRTEARAQVLPTFGPAQAGLSARLRF